MAEHTRPRERPVEDASAKGDTATKRAAAERSAPAPTTTRLPLSNGSTGDGFLFESNQHAFASWFHGIATLSDEVTQFIQRRLSDDMAAWSTMASCRTPEEAFECQRRFAEKATAQYSEEITKLSQLMLTLATQGLHSFGPKSDDTSRRT